jgi:hypothetical protein
MVEADELTEFLACLGVRGVVWSESPDDVSGGSIDDGDDVGVSLADDEVLGVEAGVGDGISGVPFVGTEQGEGVGMEDVTVPEDARVDIHTVFGLHVETELVEMLAGAPEKPGGGPVPVNLVDDVIFEEAQADATVPDGVMGKDEGVALWEEVLAGGVVADRVAFSFEIMVLPGSVVLPVLKTPGDTAVPVILIERGEITAADADVSEFVSRDEGTSGEHLGWLGEMRGPFMDDGAVHVNQDGGGVSIQQRVTFTTSRGISKDSARSIFLFKARTRCDNSCDNPTR